MKTTLSLLLIIFATHNLLAQNYTTDNNGFRHYNKMEFQQNSSNNLKETLWLTEEQVSDYLNEDSRDMDIAISNDSVIHVVYSDDVPGYPSVSRQRITYKYKKPGGSWSTPLIIDDFSGLSDRNNHEASIAVANNDDIFAVFHYWAYDGTFRNQIACSHYNKAGAAWSTEIISGDSGTVEAFYDYPVVCTAGNTPVIAWGYDNSNNYEEVYITYHDGSNWKTPLMVSNPDSCTALYPQICHVGNNKIFIAFRQYNATTDSSAIYYRLFDITTDTFTPIKQVPNSLRSSDYYYTNFDVAYKNNGNVHLALNLKDTLYAYNYNLANDTIIQNTQIKVTNLTSYINYHLISIDADENATVHIAYNIWNTSSNSIRYCTFDSLSGYSSPEIISTYSNIDNPALIYGCDGLPHILFADDREDTNNDGYVDREIYYTNASSSSEINQISNELLLHIYPNPTSTYINIEGKNISEIFIFNTVGQIVYRQLADIRNNNRISVSEYPNGLYYLQIIQNNTVVSKPIIINK